MSDYIVPSDPIIFHDRKPGRNIDPDLAHAQAIETAAWREHDRINELWMDGQATRAQVVQAELTAIAAGDEVTRIYVAQNHAGSVAAAVALELVSVR